MKIVLIIEVGDKVADTLIDKMLTAIDNKAQIGIAVGNVGRAPVLPIMMRVM